MDRRKFVSNFSLASIGLLIGCRTNKSAHSFILENNVAENSVNAVIDERLAKTMTVDDYTNIIGMPCATRQSLKVVLQNPGLMTMLNQFRTKGLLRLKSASLDPNTKMLMLNLRLEDTMHEVATCMDHFLGVHDILKSWGHPDDLASVGLIHAIYGTEFNQVRLIDCKSANARQQVAKIIGSKAENWAYMFGTLCVEDFVWQTYAAKRPATTRYDLALDSSVALTQSDFTAMIESLVANAYEPFVAIGEKGILSRLKQFEVFDPYLTSGARSAVDQYRKTSDDRSDYIPTKPSKCEYFNPPASNGVNKATCSDQVTAN